MSIRAPEPPGIVERTGSGKRPPEGVNPGPEPKQPKSEAIPDVFFPDEVFADLPEIDLLDPVKYNALMAYFEDAIANVPSTAEDIARLHTVCFSFMTTMCDYADEAMTPSEPMLVGANIHGRGGGDGEDEDESDDEDFVPDSEDEDESDDEVSVVESDEEGEIEEEHPNVTITRMKIEAKAVENEKQREAAAAREQAKRDELQSKKENGLDADYRLDVTDNKVKKHLVNLIRREWYKRCSSLLRNESILPAFFAGLALSHAVIDAFIATFGILLAEPSDVVSLMNDINRLPWQCRIIFYMCICVITYNDATKCASEFESQNLALITNIKTQPYSGKMNTYFTYKFDDKNYHINISKKDFKDVRKTLEHTFSTSKFFSFDDANIYTRAFLRMAIALTTNFFVDNALTTRRVYRMFTPLRALISRQVVNKTINRMYESGSLAERSAVQSGGARRLITPGDQAKMTNWFFALLNAVIQSIVPSSARTLSRMSGPSVSRPNQSRLHGTLWMTGGAVAVGTLAIMEFCRGVVTSWADGSVFIIEHYIIDNFKLWDNEYVRRYIINTPYKPTWEQFVSYNELNNYPYYKKLLLYAFVATSGVVFAKFFFESSLRLMSIIYAEEINEEDQNVTASETELEPTALPTVVDYIME